MPPPGIAGAASFFADFAFSATTGEGALAGAPMPAAARVALGSESATLRSSSRAEGCSRVLAGSFAATCCFGGCGLRYDFWFIVDDVIGKHEFITYATAIAPDGKVLGLEVMSYRETHGGQIRDAGWRQHFVGKTLASPFKLDEDVPNISGATLSSRNVLDGVKRLLVIHKLFLAHG